MKSRRTGSVIVLLIGAAIVLIMGRKTEPEAANDTIAGDGGSDRSRPSSSLARAEFGPPPADSLGSKGEAKLVASEGKGISLQVFGDGTYRLSLADSTGDVFVPVGTGFFLTVFSEKNPVPAGVWIKIRNGNGEILTSVHGSVGWYTPAISWSGGHVVRLDQERELLSSDQRSADFKLSDMLMMLGRNLKNQDDLEFKLLIRSNLHDFARGDDGEPLDANAFPEYETDWLDGDLLFVGE